MTGAAPQVDQPTPPPDAAPDPAPGAAPGAAQGAAPGPASGAAPGGGVGGQGGGDGKRPGADVMFPSGRTALAVFVALTYWVTVYSLPEPPVGPTSPHFGWLFAGIAVFGLSLSLLAVGHRRVSRVAAVCVVAYVLLLDWLLVSAFFAVVPYSPELKFTLAIGGIALASFIVGIVVFDTLRVAASLPIVILIIGLATAPSGFLGGSDLRGQLIMWMGIILGASAVAEGVNQGAKIIGASRVTQAIAAAQTDADKAGALQRSLAPRVAHIGGDLGPALGDPTAPPR
ncbi:hypothetical protein [Pseudonocardia sp. NPDC049154]|uniref:hypothetical protein n=1 Tax=Pseudonocardia sp. NPDC049154 TaxID=3155501 RepID=UPI0033EAD029